MNALKKSKAALLRLNFSRLMFSQYKGSNKYPSFPYKFGGIDKNIIMKVPKQIRIANKQHLQAIFGQQILKNFTIAYREYIKGLHEKDQMFVRSILQKNLTKNIQIPQTKAFNLETQIEPIVGKFNVILNGCLDRNILSKYDIVHVRSSQDEQINNYKAVSPTQPKIPKFLFAIHVYFKSTIKLVQNESLEQKSIQQKEKLIKKLQESEQLHTMQFQFQNQFSVSEFFIKGFWIVLRNLFNKQKILSQFIDYFTGSKKSTFEWKVGDIDHLLNGNHTEPKQ